MTHRLKFADEAQAKSIMAEYWSDEYGWRTASHTHSLYPLGVIYRPTGMMLESDGFEYPEMAPIDGYHINFIGELPEAATPFLVFPENPVNIYSGLLHWLNA